MNQGQTKQGVFNDNGSMLRQVINFAEEAEELLEEKGEEDEEIYFGQLKDWLREGYQKALQSKRQRFWDCRMCASLAQLVEQGFCRYQVGSSSLSNICDGIGRHSGLKISRLRSCEFESLKELKC